MWKIKAKVIRLWKQYSSLGGEAIEMVLVDAKESYMIGDKIHALIKKDLVLQFDHLLKQGTSNFLFNFALTPSCGSYRTTNHPYKIGFLPTTCVRICEDLPENVSGFQPAVYRHILDGTLDPDFLVDVIGHIVEVSHVEIVSVNGKDTHKISLELRDSNDDRLPMVLWGRFVLDVNDAIQHRSEQVLICVLRFGKIKVWKDDHRISNAYNVSDVSLNPSMAESMRFLNSIVDHKPLSLTPGVTDKEDFFLDTPKKTIAEVLETKQVENAIVLCTIAGNDSDMGWYYLSCQKCAKKLLTVPSDAGEEGDDEDVFRYNYYCVKCKNHNPIIIPRYKLHMVELDNTSNTKFMLFNNQAKQLINQPCIELTGHPSKDELGEKDVLPHQLSNLTGKNYLLKIAIERENFVYKHDTFKVMKIVPNEDMIEEFVENLSKKGYITLTDPSSQQREGFDLTPAKRVRAPSLNLEEQFDQNSVTRETSSIRIKKEKVDKSG
ncbi:hypothetical protein N665_2454s0002 [Sinapis alba]|nr:hypothetical protein N665_2454s0002 [Sinapis alba]